MSFLDIFKSKTINIVVDGMPVDIVERDFLKNPEQVINKVREERAKYAERFLDAPVSPDYDEFVEQFEQDGDSID